MDVSWPFLPHPSTGIAPRQDSAASQPGCCVDTIPGTRAHPMALGHLGLQQGRKLGWTLTLQGGTSPRGFHGPFPSTDCTDTNFILQVLKAQNAAPPRPHPPAPAVGKGLTRPCPWQCLQVGGFGVLGTPQPPGLCPLGRVPCSKPRCWGGGTVLTQG